jgi:hypothetical protein
MWYTVDAAHDRRLLVSLGEAARRFGKTDRTIRRCVADGRLSAVETPTGTMVDLSGFVQPLEEPPIRMKVPQPSPEPCGMEPADAAAMAAPGTPDATAWEFEIARLRGEVDKLSALVEQVSGERDYLRQALAASLGMQKALLAERASAAPPIRHWWQFWSRG